MQPSCLHGNGIYVALPCIQWKPSTLILHPSLCSPSFSNPHPHPSHTHTHSSHTHPHPSHSHPHPSQSHTLTHHTHTLTLTHQLQDPTHAEKAAVMSNQCQWPHKQPSSVSQQPNCSQYSTPTSPFHDSLQLPAAKAHATQQSSHTHTHELALSKASHRAGPVAYSLIYI